MFFPSTCHEHHRRIVNGLCPVCGSVLERGERVPEKICVAGILFEVRPIPSALSVVHEVGTDVRRIHAGSTDDVLMDAVLNGYNLTINGVDHGIVRENSNVLVDNGIVTINGNGFAPPTDDR